MNILEMGIEQGKELGKAEGKAEGKATSILDLLDEKGMVTENLRNTIMNQKDEAILKEWLLMAARVETVEEFADRAKIFSQAY